MPIYPEHGRWHVYFFDIDTREELDSWAWMSTGGMMRDARTGVVLTDTVLGIGVGDRDNSFTVTAEDFPGRRVGVKIWHPELTSEWRFLMRRHEPGFFPADHVPPGTPEGVLGSRARTLPRDERKTSAPHYRNRIPQGTSTGGRLGRKLATQRAARRQVEIDTEIARSPAARAAFTDRVVDLVSEFGIRQADLTGASGELLIVLQSGRAADKAADKLSMYAIPHRLTLRKALLSIPFPDHL